MKSSVDELDEALLLLKNITGYDYSDGNQKEDYRGSDLTYACGSSWRISDCFRGVNANLSNAWNTTMEVMSKILEAVDKNVLEYSNAIKAFVESTRTNEESAQVALDQANDAAQNILNELGL